MFWKMLSIRSWCLGLLLIAGLGAVFYLVLFRGAESTITQHLLSREQIIARAETDNVKSFFQVFGGSIAALTQLNSMEHWDAKTVQDLDVFVEQWRSSNLVGGVVLTDRNGLAQFNSNVLGVPEVGVSLADRDYFLWAKNSLKRGKYFVGQPVNSRLGPTKGQIIIPVAAPLYQKGAFAGVVVASVKLQPLAENYLKLMKVSNDLMEVYLIDKYGKVLYSPVPEAVGRDASELLGDNIKNALSTTQEGKLRAIYLDPKSGQPEDHLIVHSSISLGDQKWLLIISSSISQNIADLTTSVQIRQTAVLILVSLTILLFGIIAAKESKTQKSL